MTDIQLQMLRAALNSSRATSILSKLQIAVNEADVEVCRHQPNVLQLKSRSHQIEEHERALGQAVCLKEGEHLLLLGNTPAIEGFFLKTKLPIQFKRAGAEGPDPPPGAFVQAFITAWQNCQGWTGIQLYIDAPKITTQFACQRWNTAGTSPKLNKDHLNNQISHLSVRCSNGWADLPLKLPDAR